MTTDPLIWSLTADASAWVCDPHGPQLLTSIVANEGDVAWPKWKWILRFPGVGVIKGEEFSDEDAKLRIASLVRHIEGTDE